MADCPLLAFIHRNGVKLCITGQQHLTVQVVQLPLQRGLAFNRYKSREAAPEHATMRE